MISELIFTRKWFHSSQLQISVRKFFKQLSYTKVYYAKLLSDVKLLPTNGTNITLSALCTDMVPEYQNDLCYKLRNIHKLTNPDGILHQPLEQFFFAFLIQRFHRSIGTNRQLLIEWLTRCQQYTRYKITNKLVSNGKCATIISRQKLVFIQSGNRTTNVSISGRSLSSPVYYQ